MSAKSWIILVAILVIGWFLWKRMGASDTPA